MYMITNLITNCTKSQFKLLLNQDIVVLLVRVLDDKEAEQRLLQNALEAVYKYLKYDEEAGLTGEASIKEYFEASGGYDALHNLSSHPNF